MDSVKNPAETNTLYVSNETEVGRLIMSESLKLLCLWRLCRLDRLHAMAFGAEALAVPLSSKSHRKKGQTCYEELTAKAGVAVFKSLFDMRCRSSHVNSRRPLLSATTCRAELTKAKTESNDQTRVSHISGSFRDFCLDRLLVIHHALPT